MRAWPARRAARRRLAGGGGRGSGPRPAPPPPPAPRPRNRARPRGAPRTARAARTAPSRRRERERPCSWPTGRARRPKPRPGGARERPGRGRRVAPRPRREARRARRPEGRAASRTTPKRATAASGHAERDARPVEEAREDVAAQLVRAERGAEAGGTSLARRSIRVGPLAGRSGPASAARSARPRTAADSFAASGETAESAGRHPAPPARGRAAAGRAGAARTSTRAFTTTYTEAMKRTHPCTVG